MMDHKDETKYAKTVARAVRGGVDFSLATTPPAAQTLMRVLANNHTLASFAQALSDLDADPPCSYPSLADMTARKLIEYEITRQTVALLDLKQLYAIRLYHNHEPSWESNGANGIVRPKEIAKCKSAIKKQSPHSISKTSLVAAAINAEPGWNFVPYVSTFELIVDEVHGSLPPLRSLLRTSSAAYGDRPNFDVETIYKPTKEQLEALVGRFMNIPEMLRAACVQQARDANNLNFRDQARERSLGIFNAQALTPLKDAMFASGRGSTILKVALTEPYARAAEGKKEGALTHDRLVHWFWSDALENNRAKPPFIEI